MPILSLKQCPILQRFGGFVNWSLSKPMLLWFWILSNITDPKHILFESFHQTAGASQWCEHRKSSHTQCKQPTDLKAWRRDLSSELVCCFQTLNYYWSKVRLFLCKLRTKCQNFQWKRKWGDWSDLLHWVCELLVVKESYGASLIYPGVIHVSWSFEQRLSQVASEQRTQGPCSGIGIPLSFQV